MRLTKRLSDGQAALECRACALKSNGCTLYSCRQMLKDRLAAYEDTGLEPGKIMTLCDMDNRARMAGLLRKR